MAQRSKKKTSTEVSHLSWSSSTELIGLVFEVVPMGNASVFPQYTVGLHAWFLDQVRSINPELSAYLHDGESEKPFTLSGLEGEILTSGRQLQLMADQTYRWYVTALSPRVVQWLQQWVKNLPEIIELRHAPLKIRSVAIAHPPTTYSELQASHKGKTVPLTFVTPTSFRRKGHHLPLPVPINVFHSYLRRWNNFSGLPVDQDTFLEWVDECVLIQRHQLVSVKVAAGKKGSVTGFTGAIEFSCSGGATQHHEFEQLFFTLGQLAPYSGTGHKTTFGLGQTRLGWQLEPESTTTSSLQTQLAQRIEQLTSQLMALQKRTGGDRATQVCQTRATILARREFGESLSAIATDLDMPYETVKTYAKLARNALKSQQFPE